MPVELPGLPDRALRDELAAAVADGFPAQLALTRELVRCPSLRGREAGAQALMREALAGRGYAVDEVAITRALLDGHPGAAPLEFGGEGAINLVATHRPTGAVGRSLIINGHVDVVPTGPEAMWKHPPFAAMIEDDWLYGRGAGDMKSGLIAAVAALDALRRIGVQPAAPVFIESVVEEESTGNGALACHAAGYRAEAALIPEPAGEQLVRANLGVLWFEIRLQGRPAHVAESTAGADAIAAAGRLMTTLKDLEALWNAARRHDPDFRDHPHPITIQVGRIEGGDWPSSVPSWCSMHCRAGFYPSVEPRDALLEIERAVQATARRDPFLAEHPPMVICNGFHARGHVLPRGSDAEKLLAGAHQAVTGALLKATVMPAYLDARVFALYDRVPALTYGAVMERAHGFDERVSIASLQRLTQTLALFIAGWCGLERVGG